MMNGDSVQLRWPSHRIATAGKLEKRPNKGINVGRTIELHIIDWMVPGGEHDDADNVDPGTVPDGVEHRAHSLPEEVLVALRP